MKDDEMDVFCFLKLLKKRIPTKSLPKVLGLLERIMKTLEEGSMMFNDCRPHFELSLGDHLILTLYADEYNGSDAIMYTEFLAAVFDISLHLRHITSEGVASEGVASEGVASEGVHGEWLDITGMLPKPREGMCMWHLREMLGKDGENFARVDDVHPDLCNHVKQIKVTYKIKKPQDFVDCFWKMILEDNVCNGSTKEE